MEESGKLARKSAVCASSQLSQEVKWTSCPRAESRPPLTGKGVWTFREGLKVIQLFLYCVVQSAAVCLHESQLMETVF